MYHGRYEYMLLRALASALCSRRYLEIPSISNGMSPRSRHKLNLNWALKLDRYWYVLRSYFTSSQLISIVRARSPNTIRPNEKDALRTGT